ncbi:SCO0930 family lipoprotein [Streptomyces sp. B-S-A8]|uniref:SCO0930 family lipoprotein n=1 Tax=Streptomyces solicavernae TaxID=3043614 RepID=A0ABT6RXS8_9ACTN|nr:SCO0930 family lipoprotein [Streptomyces sp. B-S-A8]MDI3389203.1 SCO0930 family lipoprotein [Streptomyces sp. B-S-A8]
MNTWRSASVAVAAAALLTLTAACGQGEPDADASGRSAGNAAPAQGSYGDGYGSAAGGSGAAEAKPAGQLAVWKSKKFGEVLTDSAGFTLYRFDRDTAKPSKSACAGECAETWPVVAADGAKAAPGVDPALVGSVTREDGTEQLTVAGWPMYRYAADEKPGDAKGQGVGGTWHAAAPDGKKATAAPEGGSADEADGKGADLPGMSTRQDPELGEIVVDKNGRTVYRFTKDSAWPMKSACTGACLERWPVVEPVDESDAEGVLKKGFTVFDRPDGKQQQTLDCWPLYTFAGDKAPGDLNGQGVGGTWYAVSPEGKLLGAPE